MRAAKGQYGYLRAQTKKAAAITVLLFLISALVFLLGIYTKGVGASGLTPLEALRENPFAILRQGDKNNLLTVVAVLGVLPAARWLVQLVLLLRARRDACPEALYRRLEEARGNAPLLYDIYLTGYQRSYPLCCATAGHKELLGLLAESGGDAAGAEAHLREMLAKDGQKGVTVKVFTEEERFLERLRAIGAREAEAGALPEALRLLTEISL